MYYVHHIMKLKMYEPMLIVELV